MKQASAAGPPATSTLTWRTYTGYRHTQPGGQFADLAEDLPTVLVMRLAVWNKAWAVGVLHTAATPQDDIDRMIDEAIDRLGSRMLDPADQARYYIGEDIDDQDPPDATDNPVTHNALRSTSKPIYFPIREAVAAGYAMFAENTTRENITRYGFPTYDDAIQKLASPPATGNQPLPRKTQVATPLTLDKALAYLPEKPPASRHEALRVTTTVDPLSTVTDLLVQHDYAIPAAAAIATADTEPGDVITWDDGTFGLVLDDDVVYSADRGLQPLTDATTSPGFLSAWNVSTYWKHPKPKGFILNPAKIAQIRRADEQFLARADASIDLFETIAAKLTAGISDEVKDNQRKAASFAEAATARSATTT
ncbi:hypothetical protein [Tsukamurella hominis]|uniref:hypothetical protein n=1 Tax=Tsukamurella hominis TaxID=1970232 RepID=UPI0039EB3411